jgi:Xaa-Pro dipeptidase
MNDRNRNLRQILAKEGLDGIVCILPENILCLTGYWPSTGDSLLFYPVVGQLCLIIPSVDEPFVKTASELEVIEYEIEKDDILLANTRQRLHALLKKLLTNRGLDAGRLGVEKSFETIAGSFRGSEANVPAQPFFKGLEEHHSNIAWIDASALLKKWRQIKTTAQIQAIRRCHAIAREAFAKGRELIRPGIKEIEVSSAIESRFQEFGVGFEGVRRARGFAFAMSGPVNASNAWLPANFSTDRRLEKGDLVLIEFNGYADGYWSDLSRTFVVGEPDERQRTLQRSMRAILDSVIAEIKPGVEGKSLDRKARSLMKDHGLESYFPHYIGHGVGLAFHESPILSEGFESIIESGMVLAIEPGIYIPEYGGIRFEQNVAVADTGCDVLSDFSLEL